MATPAPTTRGYLTVMGFIDATSKVTTRLGYLTDTDDPNQPQRLQEADQPAVVVSQRDANQALVAPDTLLPTSSVHTHPSALEFTSFVGKIALATTTKTLLLAWQGNEIAKLALPAQPPALALNWQPGSKVEGVQQVTWAAKHPDGAPIESMVFFSNDGGSTFRPISASVDVQSFNVDFSLLPGGKGQIMVVTTDGGNTVSERSAIFDLPIKPAYAAVVAPRDSATLSGNWVTFRGIGYYLEEDKPETTELVWTSSRDGQLGTGPVVQTKLSPGTHDISLAVGKGARQGKASIRLQVV